MKAKLKRLLLVIFPPSKEGHYLQKNARGEYMAYCHTTGEPYFTPNREEALRYDGADNLLAVRQNIRAIWSLTSLPSIVEVEKVESP